MVGNVANAITTFLFNIMMIQYFGNAGVAAITIVMYFQFLFSSILIGYATGVAPIISFKEGAQDRPQLLRVIRISLGFIAVGSIVMFFLSRESIAHMLWFFTEEQGPVFTLSYYGFLIFSLSFLVEGYNIFTSSMLTALSEGRMSAMVSLFRSCLILIPAILLLPKVLGGTGIWYAVPVSECITLCLSIWYLHRRIGLRDLLW